MKQKPFIQEINELNHAVNEFTDAMKERIAEKAAEGKKGWEHKSMKELVEMLRQKTTIVDQTDAVDIANIAMFMYNALAQGR